MKKVLLIISILGIFCSVFGQKTISKGICEQGWYIDKFGVERAIWGNGNKDFNKNEFKINYLKNEKNRILNIKKIEVGDMICGVEYYWINDGDDYKNTYIIKIKAFVEQKLNNKFQIRVVDYTTNYCDWCCPTMHSTGIIQINANNDERPFSIKKIKLEKNGIYWIDPISDFRWSNCE